MVRSYDEYLKLLQSEIRKNGDQKLSDYQIGAFIKKNDLVRDWGIQAEDVRIDEDNILNKIVAANVPEVLNKSQIKEEKSEVEEKKSDRGSTNHIRESGKNEMDNKKVEEIKIVALGASGTGKTSFLAGIFHQFFWSQYRSRNEETHPDDELIVSITSNFMASINVDGDDNSFVKNLENFKFLREAVVSKQGTNSDDEYKVKLSITDNNEDMLVPIEIYDYKGGIAELNDISENGVYVGKLARKLQESNIIYILVDSTIAKQYDGSTGKRQLIETKLCTRFFSELLKGIIDADKYTPKYIQFVFTKWDAVDAEQRKTVLQCTKDLYGNVIRACQRTGGEYGWRYDMRPVSLFGYAERPHETARRDVSGLISYEYIFEGDMNPEGVDASFVISLENALSMKCDEKTRLRNAKERQLRRYYELMKCYHLGMKEKRKINDEIVTLQRIKDGYVKEHYNYDNAHSMLQKHTHFTELVI